MEGRHMIDNNIKFVKISPGEVFLGKNNGGLFFAAERPKHKVEIKYNFHISEDCISKEEWNIVFEKKEKIPNYDKITQDNLEEFIDILNSKNKKNKFRLPSESEWELAKSQKNILNMPNNNGELIADQPHVSYWGAPCNGTPWSEENPKAAGYSMQLTKTSNSKRGISQHKSHNDKIRFRIIKLPKEHLDSIENVLPKEFDRLELVKREVIIATLIGIIPSFIWAYFNASPGYIVSSFGNLILGGVFFSLITGLIIRPRHASLEFSQGKLITISPYRKKIKILTSFEDDAP